MEDRNKVNDIRTDSMKPDLHQSSMSQAVTENFVQPPADHTASSQKSSKKGLLISMIVLLFVALGITGYLAYRNFQPKKELPVLVQPTSMTTTDASTPTSSPFADWDTYSGDGYSFKYPKGLTTDTGAAGEGFESIRVQFMGPKQVASGRTQTSLADGYSFVVTKISSDNITTAQERAQEERVGSEASCTFEGSTVSPITETKIAGISASQYSVTECFGDYTSSYIVKSGNLYRITQLYVGEEAEKQGYKTITDQILSTFKFATQITPMVNWKNYSNSQYKLSFKYPASYTLEENLVTTSNYLQVIFNKDQASSFSIKASTDYLPANSTYFLDTEPTGQKTIGSKVWNTYYLPNGYGDGPEPSTAPIYGLQTEASGVLYTVTFYNQSSIDSTQEQVLSTLEL